MKDLLPASRCSLLSCHNRCTHKWPSNFKTIPSIPLRTSSFGSFIKSSASSSVLWTLLPFHKSNIGSMTSNAIFSKPSFSSSRHLLCRAISSFPSSSSSNTVVTYLKTITVSQGTTHHLVTDLCVALLLVSLADPFCSTALASDAAIAIESSSKISLESVLVAIDDFFNRYPYFVASVTFIWLVVIPLTQEYLKKFKYCSAIDAFRKLREDPSSQLLDIRKRKSVEILECPNLTLLKKEAVVVEYSVADEAGFVNKVLQEFGDPPNTTLCIMDSLDGNSLRVAQLLYENGGFKAAYAIKGGIQGKDGWQQIQETLLPPSLHVYPRKSKGKRSALFDRRESKDQKVDTNTGAGGE